MYQNYQTHYQSDEILIYLRKSRSDDPTMTVEEVLSNHEQLLNEWVERNIGEPVPPENYYREVGSGETLADRPEIQKVLKRIESPRIKAVLVVEIQRLSRGDLEDCGKLMKLLRYTHTHVITLQKTYDLDDEYDRDVFERELKRGNEYLEYFKKIQRRGTQLSVQDGNYLGSIPPYGYDKIKVIVGKKKCPTLVPNEAEAKVVRMIFDWYANENIGSATICNRLNDMGIPTRNGGKWTRGTIREILDNEHYIGKIRFYKRVTEHTVNNTEILKKKNYRKDYQLHDGKHEAIIAEEIFNKVKELKGSKPKRNISTTLTNPLAGILYCECGKCMAYKTSHNKYYYMCENMRYCGNSNVSVDDIINDVKKMLEETLENYQLTVKSNNSDRGNQIIEQITLLERQLSEAEKKELNIWEKYAEEAMPKEIFEQLRKKCEEDKQSIKRQLSKLHTERTIKNVQDNVIFKLHEAINALNDPSANAEAKNYFLKQVFEKIVYSRPASVRIGMEEAKSQGISTINGWYRSPYHLEYHLRF